MARCSILCRQSVNLTLTYLAALVCFIIQYLVVSVYLMAATDRGQINIKVNCNFSRCLIFNCSEIHRAITHDMRGGTSGRFSNWAYYLKGFGFSGWQALVLFANIALLTYIGVAWYLKVSARCAKIERGVCCASPSLCERALNRLLLAGPYLKVVPWEPIFWFVHSLVLSLQVAYLTVSKSLECLSYTDSDVANLLKLSIALSGVLFVAFVKMDIRGRKHKFQSLKTFETTLAWSCGINIMDGASLLDNLLPQDTTPDSQLGAIPEVVSALPHAITVAITTLSCLTFCLPTVTLFFIYYGHRKMAVIKSGEEEAEREKCGAKKSESDDGDKNRPTSQGCFKRMSLLRKMTLMNDLIFVTLDICFIAIRTILIIRHNAIISVFLVKNCVALVRMKARLVGECCGVTEDDEDDIDNGGIPKEVPMHVLEPAHEVTPQDGGSTENASLVVLAADVQPDTSLSPSQIEV